MMGDIVLELRALEKNYGAVQALGKVNITVRRGEIHGLVGANGSGKSTLLNILFGNRIIQDTGGYRGEIFVDGKKATIQNTQDALLHGMGMIHQEFALIPEMTIVENIKLSRENTKNFCGRFWPRKLAYIDRQKNSADAARILQRLGLSIDTDLLVKRISTNIKQFVEIAREMAKDDLKILFLDEPTAVLNQSDSAKLMLIIQELAASGTAIIFISHRLEEICQVCQRVTVLRDGRAVASYEKEALSIKTLAREMIGGEITAAIRQKRSIQPEVTMSFRDFQVEMPGEQLRGLDLDIHTGEILGITSLSGHGKLALGYGVSGFYPTRGEAIYRQQPFHPGDTKKNIDQGIYFLPDDRKGLGLLLNHSVRENIVFAGFQIKNLFSAGIIPGLARIDQRAAAIHVAHYIRKFDIKCQNQWQKVRELSGGNQQKVCLARALTLFPRILFISEPTRGVDIGAKEKLLQMIVEINEKEGTTIVMASSELEELKRICDRIAVITEGRLKAILPPTAAEIDFALAISGEEAGG